VARGDPGQQRLGALALDPSDAEVESASTTAARPQRGERRASATAINVKTDSVKVGSTTETTFHATRRSENGHRSCVP
jgi:hypothetical protein